MKELLEYIREIEDVNPLYGEKTQQHQDCLTKPSGSLGTLEHIAVEIASIKKEFPPKIDRKVIFILAGDHGVVREGVSAFPQEVTAQMIYNFLRGGAAINVLTRHVEAEVIVGDFGVASDIKACQPNFKNCKINYGTANIAKGPAMTKAEAVQSIMIGIRLFEEEYKKKKIDLVGTGEMGIANTTPATAILAVVSGANVKDIVGRGTGIDDESLKRKIRAVKSAMRLNNPQKNNGVDILQKIGGYEIGGLTGIILGAARNKVPVLIDGFISTASALIASKLNPLSVKYMIASHQSSEPGHIRMLEILGKKPILDLNLRLGEGTGSAVAMHIVEAAIKIINEMATFENASVSQKMQR